MVLTLSPGSVLKIFDLESTRPAVTMETDQGETVTFQLLLYAIDTSPFAPTLIQLSILQFAYCNLIVIRLLHSAHGIQNLPTRLVSSEKVIISNRVSRLTSGFSSSDHINDSSSHRLGSSHLHRLSSRRSWRRADTLDQVMTSGRIVPLCLEASTHSSFIESSLSPVVKPSHSRDTTALETVVKNTNTPVHPDALTVLPETEKGSDKLDQIVISTACTCRQRVMQNGRRGARRSRTREGVFSMMKMSFCSLFFPRRRMRVLVVEDSLPIQKMMRRWLEMSQCEVDILDNGLVGLELLKRIPFDIVFTDFVMVSVEIHHHMVSEAFSR